MAFDDSINSGYTQLLETRMAELTREVFDATGIKVNLASPQQVASLIFDVLGLTPRAEQQAKLKTSHRSTADLSTFDHPVALAIHNHRQCSKFLSTYVKGISPVVCPASWGRGSRIFPKWNQRAVVTGRISCSNPNMQTLPKATDVRLDTRRNAARRGTPEAETSGRAVGTGVDYHRCRLLPG